MIICQMLIKFFEGPKNSLFETPSLQPFPRIPSLFKLMKGHISLQAEIIA